MLWQYLRYEENKKYLLGIVSISKKKILNSWVSCSIEVDTSYNINQKYIKTNQIKSITNHIKQDTWLKVNSISSKAKIIIINK